MHAHTIDCKKNCLIGVDVDSENIFCQTYGHKKEFFYDWFTKCTKCISSSLVVLYDTTYEWA